MNKTIETAGAGDTMTIEPSANSVVITVAGKVIADSARALVMREAGRPPVVYVPRKDVDMTRLTRTGHATHCPHKGDCAYYSIGLGGERSVNAAWSYEAPRAAAAAIKGYLAFYPDRVDSIVEWPDERGLPLLPWQDAGHSPYRHAA